MWIPFARSAILLFCLFFILFTPIANCSPPKIEAQAAILIDAKTGQILFEKNSHIRNAPASTTKVLTAIIAIESGRLDEEVKVSSRAANTAGSSMHLSTGQLISMRELVIGLLLRSGNDAAVAIAEHLAGSVDNFVMLMNEKAQSLDAANSHFANPHGLTAVNHYSTAFDLAWIARYALTNPLFSMIVNTKETNIEWLDRKGKEHDQSLKNTNKLLWLLEEADGVKTGTTNQAGPCLISSATRGNQKLIAVVLHDHSRWYDSMQLLKYGFDAFELYEYAAKNDILGSIPVEEGIGSLIDAVVSNTASVVVPAADYEHVTVSVNLPEQIKAPVYQGQKIGEIVFLVHQKAIKTVDITSGQTIEERTNSKILLQYLLRTFRLLSSWGAL
ncbi:D-alanyl-D-alanine carboxypeptidase family protein [Pelosinus propionicus]|uniref:serine-type D-Ala-D-Ala carboxypeptidase n=1 Tax=Pelosinus propionicus DSM 13327 TaxID=1123291 RepID=A0A1I4HKE5_9FIRM|nr:D-alanyl-D-alanine carboxypeptidase family protein [Pelosinus propionicus]SFL42672.1 D-alanyl-D-alanine carboxypeptidase (penicillin-binding protein 5/6) [Pelosinus propionicus DSM 13327]